MSTNIFQAGDRVIIDPVVANKDMKGRVFEVVRHLKVDYDLKPLDGVGPFVRAQPGCCYPPRGTVGQADRRGGRALVDRLHGPGEAARNIDPKTLFVVPPTAPR